MSTEKKFVGYVETEPTGDLIASLPALPPGQPEAQPVFHQQQNNHAAAGVPVAPRFNQPLKQQQQQQAIAGVHSLPPTRISAVTGDGQVVRTELVMEGDDDTGQQDKKSKGGKTGKDDVVEENKESSTDCAQSPEEIVSDEVNSVTDTCSGKADIPLSVSMSGSEEPVSKPDGNEEPVSKPDGSEEPVNKPDGSEEPVSKLDESDAVKMKSSGAASESKKAAKDPNKDPSIQEFTSNLQTDRFKTSNFKTTSKIQKFSKRLRVKWMKDIKAELIPHIIGTDGSCWTYARISATVERQLLTDMKARKEFGTVRLASQVLHGEYICSQHDPVQVRENGEVCFMCKVLDTNKELSQWNERTFPVSLEVVLQIHSTCFLNVQEIESDFMSVTEEDI